MDLEGWHEVDRLFEEALDLPPAERPAFLDAACAGDSALRQKLERLLASDAEGSGFLAGPTEELLRLTLDDREEGGTLGPYRLLRRIGNGGMGTVYLARRDEPYQRDVAVKVLRSGLASTEARHRFIAERQILAGLEHPNIARLYDGGSTDDGRPYLILELIDGLPVDRFCDRHRLTIDQRIALFRKICGAVQHAHQNLLVHRDLKPANILVTPEGEPKLLDFGIAKRLAPGGALQETRTGLRMMTPSYASPEQVRGDAITTASDIYSLGVILYELLAGRSPYRASAELPYEIERAICEQEPERPGIALFRPGPPGAEEIAAARRTRPSALGRRLQGDLDNIVLMALRKEPRRRYGSAAELSRDLEMHLQDLPVSARSDTLRYRSRKFVRRHRAAVTATAAIVLLTAGSVASLVAQRRQLARERDKARYALSFLVDTFEKADPYRTKGETLTAREILDQGTARVARGLPGDPEAQAAVLEALGEVNLGLGRYDAAEPLLTRSLALRRQTSGAASLDVAESLEHLAVLRNERSDRAGAEAHLREALAIRRRLQGNDRLAVAKTLNRLGTTLHPTQGVSPEGAPEVEALHQEALLIARDVEGPAGPTVAETLFALADLQQVRGSYAEAERLFREGLVIQRAALGDQDLRLYRERSSLGAVLFYAGKLDEAETVLQSCLAAQRQLLGREHPDVATSLNNLAAVVQARGRYAEAEALQREILAMARSQYGPTHWRVALVLVNLASAVDAGGRAGEAIPYYEEALDIRRRTLGEEAPEVAQILLLLAELHRNTRNPSRALELAHQALEVLEKAEGPDHPHVAYALREIGRNYSNRSQYAEAEPFLRRSLDIRRRRLEAGHPDLAKAQFSLGKCLIGLKGHDEAAVLLRQARATYSVVYGPSHQMTREADVLLAGIERLRSGDGLDRSNAHLPR